MSDNESLHRRLLRATEVGEVEEWTTRLAVMARQSGLSIADVGWVGSPGQVAYEVIELARQTGKRDALERLVEERLRLRQEAYLTLLREAYVQAGQSPDPSTQNGAVLFNPWTGRIVARGFNGFPQLVRALPERLEQAVKGRYIEHAERACIYEAARSGISTDGLWMACSWMACADCARAIICAGIDRVIRHRLPEHASRADWAASIAVGDTMFKEAGVEIVEVTERVGAIIRFKGERLEV